MKDEVQFDRRTNFLFITSLDVRRHRHKLDKTRLFEGITQLVLLCGAEVEVAHQNCLFLRLNLREQNVFYPGEGFLL